MAPCLAPARAIAPSRNSQPTGPSARPPCPYYKSCLVAIRMIMLPTRYGYLWSLLVTWLLLCRHPFFHHLDERHASSIASSIVVRPSTRATTIRQRVWDPGIAVEARQAKQFGAQSKNSHYTSNPTNHSARGADSLLDRQRDSWPYTQPSSPSSPSLPTSRSSQFVDNPV